MTKDELKQEADKESYKYNKKYSEDYKLKDMLSRPMDFVEGAIEGVVKLLKIKAYRDGYLASAEPREKRITDLEATNKNISNECHKLVDSLEKKQKEVAELKEKNKWYSEQVCNKECAEVWGNLDKATDLLKWFVWYFREGSPNLVPYKHKVAETEQFISEGKKGMTENSNVPECPSIKIGCDKMYYVDEVEK
jgi:hypothetical protein